MKMLTNTCGYHLYCRHLPSSGYGPSSTTSWPGFSSPTPFSYSRIHMAHSSNIQPLPSLSALLKWSIYYHSYWPIWLSPWPFLQNTGSVNIIHSSLSSTSLKILQWYPVHPAALLQPWPDTFPLADTLLPLPWVPPWLLSGSINFALSCSCSCASQPTLPSKISLLLKVTSS